MKLYQCQDGADCYIVLAFHDDEVADCEPMHCDQPMRPICWLGPHSDNRPWRRNPKTGVHEERG